MVRRYASLLAPLVFLAGCSTPRSDTRLVPDTPFGTDAMAPTPHVTLSPATAETAARVEAVRQKLLAANPQLGIKPLVATAGQPQPEIFHHGTSDVVVTEGLVTQCADDRLLAAVLALEFGKMISEREAQNPTRKPERLPPMTVPIGANGSVTRGWADHSDQAQIWKLDADRTTSQAPTGTPPDPKVLARTYLTHAGYDSADLDTATPILQAAASNTGLEKQFAPAK